jgi:protein-S-isoprenylcysteine O-methyltransferase Ste14
VNSLSRSTSLKMLVPILYAVLAVIYFVYVSTQITFQAHHIIGAVVTLVAFILWIIARLQLGNSFSLSAQAKGLVTTGLYGKLRHPVYYFSILAAIGLAIFVWNTYMFLFVLLLFAVEIIRIREEEKVLRRTFGKEYLDYRSKTWF